MPSHPQSGQTFRLSIDGGNVLAGYDLLLHGSVFKLTDWADRMHLDSNLQSGDRETAVLFYAHRCLPDRLDLASTDGIDLSGLIYGSIKFQSTETFEEVEHIVVVRQSELVNME